MFGNQKNIYELNILVIRQLKQSLDSGFRHNLTISLNFMVKILFIEIPSAIRSFSLIFPTKYRSSWSVLIHPEHMSQPAQALPLCQCFIIVPSTAIFSSTKFIRDFYSFFFVRRESTLLFNCLLSQKFHLLARVDFKDDVIVGINDSSKIDKIFYDIKIMAVISDVGTKSRMH